MLKTAKKHHSPIYNLNEFYEKYGTILEVAARRVRTLVGRGQLYTPTEEVAQWITKNLPLLSLDAFGRGPKLWRIMSMLSIARYLGAYEALGIRALRGKGLTTGEGETTKRGRLKVIPGGRRS